MENELYKGIDPQEAEIKALKTDLQAWRDSRDGIIQHESEVDAENIKLKADNLELLKACKSYRAALSLGDNELLSDARILINNAIAHAQEEK